MPRTGPARARAADTSPGVSGLGRPSASYRACRPSGPVAITNSRPPSAADCSATAPVGQGPPAWARKLWISAAVTSPATASCTAAPGSLSSRPQGVMVSQPLAVQVKSRAPNASPAR